MHTCMSGHGIIVSAARIIRGERSSYDMDVPTNWGSPWPARSTESYALTHTQQEKTSWEKGKDQSPARSDGSGPCRPATTAFASILPIRAKLQAEEGFSFCSLITAWVNHRPMRCGIGRPACMLALNFTQLLRRRLPLPSCDLIDIVLLRHNLSGRRRLCSKSYHSAAWLRQIIIHGSYVKAVCQSQTHPQVATKRGLHRSVGPRHEPI